MPSAARDEGSSIVRQLETWHDRWHGPSWRSWALAAGIGLVVAAAIVAALVSVLLDERMSVLLTVALLVEMLCLCMSGTGMLTSTSRRMSRGGLARETATIDTDRRPPEERKADTERDRMERDRRTIRAGIMVLPVFLAVIAALAW